MSRHLLFLFVLCVGFLQFVVGQHGGAIDTWPAATAVVPHLSDKRFPFFLFLFFSQVEEEIIIYERK
jgi:hypothetical protein